MPRQGGDLDLQHRQGQVVGQIARWCAFAFESGQGSLRRQQAPRRTNDARRPHRQCRRALKGKHPHRRDARSKLTDLGRGSGDRLLSWSMTTLPLSAVKARLSEIAEEVQRTHQRVQITKNGRSYVVLISAEDLASLEATVELLSDPAAMERVRQAQDDLEGGRFTTGEQMSQLMRERRAAAAGD